MKREIRRKLFSAVISQLLIAEPLLKIFMLTSPLILVNLDGTDAVISSSSSIAPAATIQRLDVQCAENGMNVVVELSVLTIFAALKTTQFNQPFNGVIFSKGFYNDARCVYANRPNTKTIQFSISAGSCGTVVGKFNPNSQQQQQTRVKRESPFAVVEAGDNTVVGHRAQHQLDFGRYNNDKFALLARHNLHGNDEFQHVQDKPAESSSPLPVIRVSPVESIRPVITLQHPFHLEAATEAHKKVFSNDSSVSAQFDTSTLKNGSQPLPQIVIIDAVTTKQNPSKLSNSKNSLAGKHVTKEHVVIIAPQSATLAKSMANVEATEKQLSADAVPKTAKNEDEARLLKSIHDIDVPVVNGNPPVPGELLSERKMGERFLRADRDLSGGLQAPANKANNNVEHLHSTLTERANPMDAFDTDAILEQSASRQSGNRLNGRTGMVRGGGSSLPSQLDPRVGDPMAGPLLDSLNFEASRVMPDLTRDVPDLPEASLQHRRNAERGEQPNFDNLSSRMSIKQQPSEHITLEATGNLNPRTNIRITTDDQHRTSRIRFGGGSNAENDELSIIFNGNKERNEVRKNSILDLRAPSSGREQAGEKPIEPTGFGADMELSVLGDIPDGGERGKSSSKKSERQQQHHDESMFENVGLVRRLPSNLNFPPMPPPNYNGGGGGRSLQQRNGPYGPPGIGGGFFGGNGDGVALIGRGGGDLQAKSNNNNNFNIMDNGGYGHFGSLATTDKDGKQSSADGNTMNPRIMTGILAANNGRQMAPGKARKILDLRAPYGGGPENVGGDPGFSSSGRYFQQPPSGQFAGFSGPGGLRLPNGGALGTRGLNFGGGVGNGQYLNLRAPSSVMMGPQTDQSDPGFASDGRYFNAPPPQRRFGFEGGPPRNGFNGPQRNPQFNNGPMGPRFGMMPNNNNMMNGPQAMNFGRGQNNMRGGPNGNPDVLTSRQVFPPQFGGSGGAPGQIAKNNKFSPGYDPGFGTFDAGANQFLDGIPAAAGGSSGIREANPNFDVDSLDVPEPNGAAFGDFNESPGGSAEKKLNSFDKFVNRGSVPLQQFINLGPQPPAVRFTQAKQSNGEQSGLIHAATAIKVEPSKPSTQIRIQTDQLEQKSSDSGSGVVVINSQQSPTTTTTASSKTSSQSQQQEEISSALQVLVEQEAQQADQRLREQANRQKQLEQQKREQLQQQQQKIPFASYTLDDGILTTNNKGSTVVVKEVPIESRLNFPQVTQSLPSITLPSLELEQPSVTNIILPSPELHEKQTASSANVVVLPSVDFQRSTSENLVLPSLDLQMQQLQQDTVVPRQNLRQQDINININSQKSVVLASTTNAPASVVVSSSTVSSNTNDYIENVIIIQNDPDLQEVFDVARALRCEWRNSYRKTVGTESRTSDGIPNGAMLQTIMADVEMMRFTGDDVDIWMQLKSGKGPDAQPVSGIVPLGHPMTLVIGLNDPKNEFDLRVGRCHANDGNDHKILLTDDAGCVLKSKVMRPFEKARNWGANKATIAFSEFSAFKFPEKTEVYIECDVEACKGSCADMCPVSAQRLQLGRGLTSDDKVPESSIQNNSANNSTAQTTITLNAKRKRRSVSTQEGKTSALTSNDDEEQLKSLRSMYKAVSHNDLAFNFAPELLHLDSATMERLIAMGTPSAALTEEAQHAAAQSGEADSSAVAVCVTRTTLILCVALGSTLASIALVLLIFIVCRSWRARRSVVAQQKKLRETKKAVNASVSSSINNNRMIVGRY